ncbi:MAG: hypothetical protein J7M24_04115 [Candidatus Latescibacteria bacterium]|nr:hypothetical protein [Candidatus Latescibacterota bacterium]
MKENDNIIPFSPFKQKPADIPLMDACLPPLLMSVAEILEIDDMFTGEQTPEHRINGVTDQELALALKLTLLADGESLNGINDFFINEVILNSTYPSLMTVGDFLSRFDDDENLLMTMSLEDAVHEVILNQKTFRRLTLDVETVKIGQKGCRLKNRNARYANTVVLVVAVEAEMMIALDIFEKGIHPGIGMYRPLLRALSIVPDETDLHLRSGSMCYHHEVASFCEEMDMSFTISADLTDSFLQRIQAAADTALRSYRSREEIMELDFQPEGWDQAHRHVVMRKKSGEDIFGPLYSYDAFVTNISNKNIKKTARLHKRQPSAERIIDELLKDYFPGHS